MTFSIGALFANADIVIKAVMTFLFFASVWSWYIFFKKFFQIQRVRRLSKTFAQRFAQEQNSFEQLYNKFAQYPRDPFALAFRAAVKEMPATLSGSGWSESMINSVKSHLEEATASIEVKEIASLEQGVGFLASMASTAPFVGLFGTVWGIMMSFSAIAESGDTNLTVVAPAISEALFATALGLFVAIPATLAYNKITNLLRAYETELALFTKDMRLVLMKRITRGRRQ
ncbi:MotA/TolQ/ExbB proton channel family protein [Candidatus Hepatobacter penaei]|uniref:MotA/TolQ/ExbB proton channel family protein n=1 Tax=Candidatus Hepatobacter penaei TaxID=1274402 RepID=UPI0004F35107|nr:MotA/TolQ/ExbB proton channel family protein [Candidatus Hepatobacter penaei]TGW15691.1 hypothetical protein EIL50_01085 [bacterium NHP-B]